MQLQRTAPIKAQETVEIKNRDRIAVYTLVIERVSARGDSVGRAPSNKQVMYVVGATDDRAGDPSAMTTESRVLSRAVRRGLADRLDNLYSELKWVDSFDRVVRDSRTGKVEKGGVVITLGNIVSCNDGSVRVSASIYSSPLDASGGTYLLKRTNGTWTIIGTADNEWIS
jgi:hypothetical protein